MEKSAASKNAHLGGLHKIIQKTTYTQALFFWVDGAMNTNPKLTPRKAIVEFAKKFEITDLDVRSAVTQFNRMKSLYIKNNKVFQS